MGLGLSSLWAFSPSALAHVSLASASSEVNSQETLDNFEDEDMKAAFERWKSKSYALTVPLRIVALEGSVPPVWIREFLRSQGKRVQFCPEFRRSLKDIFNELCNPYVKGKINPKSAVAADLVTIGDSWLNFAIGKGLIEPLNGAEDEDWFRDFSDKWKTRVIVEKPFGRDSESSAALTKALKQYLREDQIFRIDHCLGKEVVENLSVLRFSNLIFEKLWSRQYIRNVQLIFSKDFGTEGRGGYFDHYGIIRDIMQSHLLQILVLFAMETPVSLDAEDIKNEKVKVLRSMRPLRVDDGVIGQYKSGTKGDVMHPGYTDDKTVPKDNLTPTFAAAALVIDNARWDGVPFLMKAGKALHNRRAEIRVQFRNVPGNLYNRNFGTDLDRVTNELVIHIEPDEAIYLKINNEVPSLGMRIDRSNLNLLYKARYPEEIPDAYERLLLDAIEEERRLFVSNDELDAAWALFTLVLKELEEKKVIPEYYSYGSRGPVGAHDLAARSNVEWGDLGVDE